MKIYQIERGSEKRGRSYRLSIVRRVSCVTWGWLAITRRCRVFTTSPLSHLQCQQSSSTNNYHRQFLQPSSTIITVSLQQSTTIKHNFRLLSSIVVSEFQSSILKTSLVLLFRVERMKKLKLKARRARDRLFHFAGANASTPTLTPAVVPARDEPPRWLSTSGPLPTRNTTLSRQEALNDLLIGNPVASTSSGLVSGVSVPQPVVSSLASHEIQTFSSPENPNTAEPASRLTVPPQHPVVLSPPNEPTIHAVVFCRDWI